MEAILPVSYKAIIKYFGNIRNIKCLLKNISVPDTATCEASCEGVTLVIVWDNNDQTTQWLPATSDLKIAPDVIATCSNMPPISKKRKAPAAPVNEGPGRSSEQASSQVLRGWKAEGYNPGRYGHAT
jgi:hypothetical protein